MTKKKKAPKNSFIKNHKVLLIVASCLVAVFLLPMLYLGWLGLMPGVSSVFGSDKPRDLGVQYDNLDLQTYKQKTSIAFVDSVQTPQDPTNPSQKQVLTNPKYAQNLTLSDEEVTASINSLGKSWLPLEDVQVRFTNGSMELSGMLNLEKLDEFNAHASGSKNAGLNSAINWAKLFNNNVPFYAKAQASVKDNTLTYTIDAVEIGRVTVPLSRFNKEVATANASAYIKTKNFSIDSAQLSEGNLTFSGVYPTIIYLDL